MPDYGNALNGLQLEAQQEVSKVALAVDASEEAIDMAIEMECDLLFVHHGIFWQGHQPLRGAFGRKVKKAYAGGLSIYSAHLPLDVHETSGNNQELARLLNLKVESRFCDYKGMLIGLMCSWEGSFDDLVERCRMVLGEGVKAFPACQCAIPKVALITGGAGDLLQDAKKAGADVFITGEGAHWTAPLAKEIGLGLIYGGHYATEQFGVQAVGRWLRANFELPTLFLDFPTGL